MSPSIPSPVLNVPQQMVRLVLEAQCSSCGLLCDTAHELRVVQVALAHTAATGHIVILNGTVDLPDQNEAGVSSAPPQEYPAN
jgi:hypothetical protein